MIQPAIADFKAYFRRDFPYGSTAEKVADSDIQKAFDQATCLINEGLFASQTAYNIGFLTLAAHYLVMDFRNSSLGVKSEYDWLRVSKSVSGTAYGYTIPQYILDHPVLGMLSQTGYGAKYLTMVLGNLAGQMFTVTGTTQA